MKHVWIIPLSNSKNVPSELLTIASKEQSQDGNSLLIYRDSFNAFKAARALGCQAQTRQYVKA